MNDDTPNIAYMELVELPNGTIVLRRIEDHEAVVKISFSESISRYLNEDKMEVVRSMMQAGFERFNDLMVEWAKDNGSFIAVDEEKINFSADNTANSSNKSSNLKALSVAFDNSDVPAPKRSKQPKQGKQAKQGSVQQIDPQQDTQSKNSSDPHADTAKKLAKLFSKHLREKKANKRPYKKGFSQKTRPSRANASKNSKSIKDIIH